MYYKRLVDTHLSEKLLNLNPFSAPTSTRTALSKTFPFMWECALCRVGHSYFLWNTVLSTSDLIVLVSGGMPEVVAAFAKNAQLNYSQRILDDLFIALRADFSKYKNTVPPSRLVEVFESVVQQAGGKFKFSKASLSANHGQIKGPLPNNFGDWNTWNTDRLTLPQPYFTGIGNRPMRMLK